MTITPERKLANRRRHHMCRHVEQQAREVQRLRTSRGTSFRMVEAHAAHWFAQQCLEALAWDEYEVCCKTGEYMRPPTYRGHTPGLTAKARLLADELISKRRQQSTWRSWRPSSPEGNPAFTS
jgi:hypothetical protein